MTREEWEAQMRMPLTSDIRDQIAEAYRNMARADYRPGAPSDGMGYITVPEDQLDIDEEIQRYAAQWWASEDKWKFDIGCCNYPTREVTIYLIEAARLLCAAADGTAYKLLKLAAQKLGAMDPVDIQDQG